MKTCNTRFEDLVHDVLASELGTHQLSLVPVPTYPDTIVYEAKTGAGKYIFKAAEPGGRDPDGIGLEAWTIGTATANGVPTPRVTAIDLTHEHFPGSFFVMECVEGSPLDSFPTDHPSRPRLLREVGAGLRRLHSVGIRGFGWLDEQTFRDTGQTRGTYATWAEAVLPDVPQALDYLREVQGLTPEQADLAADLVRQSTGLLDSRTESCLLHGDLGTSHVFVDPANAAITGIIDWGERAAGDPVWDFIQFDPTEVPHILEGYDPSPQMSGRFASTYNLYRLAHAIPWASKWHRRGEIHVTDYLVGLLETL